MTRPLITVVIPTKNRGELLRETLLALGRQEGMPGPLEVVVADDGSTDATAASLDSARASFPGSLHWIRLSSAGPAAARNRAIERASADRILLLGDDTLPETGVLASHLAGAARGDVALQGRIEWDPASPITPVMRFLAPEGPQHYFKGLRHGRPIPYTALYAANLSAPAAWFREDPFDEDFPAAAFEDTELAYRWHRRGRTVLYWETAVCRHRHLYETIEPFLSRQGRAGSAARRAIRLHPGMAGRTLIQPVLAGAVVAGRYAVRRLAGKKPEADLWDLRARAAFLRGFFARDPGRG